MGREAYEQEDYKHAVQWFTHAHTIASREQQGTVDDFLGFSYFKLNNVPSAIEHTKLALEVYPRKTRLINNLAYYGQVLLQKTKSSSMSTESAEHETAAKDNILQRSESEMAAFRALCQGHNLLNSTRVQPTCHLKRDHPLLALRPQAVENILPNTTQDIKIFRHFMSPAECDQLIAISRPFYERSLAYNGTTLVAADYRIRSLPLVYCLIFSTLLSRLFQPSCVDGGQGFRSRAQDQPAHRRGDGHGPEYC